MVLLANCYLFKLESFQSSPGVNPIRQIIFQRKTNSMMIKFWSLLIGLSPEKDSFLPEQ
jgi:hypothetical protein